MSTLASSAPSTTHVAPAAAPWTAKEAVQPAGERRYFSGTFRTRAPEDTLALITPYLARAGITRVAVVTGLDVIGLPVVMVTRPASRSLSVTQGKGATLAAAKVSGIMEALEHFCAESIDAPLRYASAREMIAQGRRVVDCSRLSRTASALTSGTPISWIAGRSLLDGAEVWLPYELVHLDYRLPLPSGSGHFLASSNGLASGNTLLEASCHALYESIERHETDTFYALPPAAQELCRVKLDSITDELCCQLLERLREAQVRAAVWDLSSDLGVACFLCDLLDQNRDHFRMLARARGIGCHSDRGVALARALCEAAQSRLTMIAGSRDDISRRELCEARSAETWEYASRQIEGGGRASRDFARTPSQSFTNFEQERSWLVGRLARAGHDAPVLVELSQAQLPIAVARVVTPGLRAPHARDQMASGRASR